MAVGPSALEPHVPQQPVRFVVLLLFSHLPLPLLLLHVSAQLAHFRQRKAEGDCANSKKKTAKRKGPAVAAPVQEERPVATEDSGRLGVRDGCRPCGDLPVGATGPSEGQVGVFRADFLGWLIWLSSIRLCFLPFKSVERV